MLIPVTLTAVILRPKSWQAWAGVAIAGVCFGRAFMFPATGWLGGGLILVKWTLETAALSVCPTLGLVVFILICTGIGTLAVKAADAEASWAGAGARAYVALMASLAMWYPLYYFGAGNLRMRSWSLPALRTAMALVPVMILAALLWRTYRGAVLWIGVMLASVALFAVAVFDSDRLKIGDVAVVPLAAIVAPGWAYWDWRRSRAILLTRGFEVIMPAS
jgi:hypothetical protein